MPPFKSRFASVAAGVYFFLEWRGAAIYFETIGGARAFSGYLASHPPVFEMLGNGRSVRRVHP